LGGAIKTSFDSLFPEQRRTAMFGRRAIAVVPLALVAACGSGVQNGNTAPTTSSKLELQYSQFVDVPGATSTTVHAINDVGATVGDFTDSGGAHHAFIRGPGGTVATVDIPGASRVTLRGINDAGVAVGFYSVDTPQGANAVTYHGFERTPDGITTVIDLPDAGDSALLGINNIGDIVGQYDLVDQSVGGSFVLKQGRFTTLQDPPGAVPFNVFARAINDLGAVSGSFLGVDGNTHAFLLRGNTYTTFDDIGATLTALKGLNDRGQSVGVSDVGGGFVFDIATLSITTYIDCPGGLVAFPEGINNQGQIAGTCELTVDSPPFHGFVLTP
jgi:hypothetical protein